LRLGFLKFSIKQLFENVAQFKEQCIETCGILQKKEYCGKQMHENISLLQSAIRDACIDFASVSSLEEAGTVITLKELQEFLPVQLKLKLKESEKDCLTLNFLRLELFKNNFFSTEVNNGDGASEVWMLKKIR